MQWPRAKVAALTRKVNELQALLAKHPAPSKDCVSQRYEEFQEKVAAFQRECEELSKSLPPEDLAALKEWQVAKLIQYQPIIDKVNDFLVPDSVSETSKSSNISAVSHASAAMLTQLAMKRAKANADRSCLEEEHELEGKKSALNLRRLKAEADAVTLKMQIEADAIAAKLKEEEAARTLALQERELSAKRDALEIENMEKEIFILNGLEGATCLPLGTASQLETERDKRIFRKGKMCHSDVGKDEGYQYLLDDSYGEVGYDRESNVKAANVLPSYLGINHPLSNVNATEALPSIVGTYRPMPYSDGNQNSRFRLAPAAPPYGDSATHRAGEVDPLGSSLSSQNIREIIEATAAALSAAQVSRNIMPPIELTPFDGKDLTQFNSFFLQFERLTNAKNVTDEQRFQILLQYTEGAPRELVRSFDQASATAALTGSKQALIERFGDPFAIAQAFIIRLKQWPEIKPNNPKAVEALYIYLSSCLNMSGQLAPLNQLNSPCEIMNIVRKLPYDLQKSFRTFSFDLRRVSGTVTFADLVKFMQRQASILNSPIFSEIGNADKLSSAVSIRKRILATSVPRNPTSSNRSYNSKLTTNPFCYFCGPARNDHVLARCINFNNKSYDEKVAFIRRTGICFGCLDSTAHKSRQCLRRLTCNTCNRQHPSTIHKPVATHLVSDRLNAPEMGNVNITANTIRTMVSGVNQPVGNNRKLLHSIIPVRVGRNDGPPIEVYASLDSCSSDCWISSRLLDQLSLPVTRAKVPVTTMAGDKTLIAIKVINNLNIFDCENNNRVTIPVLYANEQDWPFAPRDAPNRADLEAHQHLANVPFKFINANIELLIGMNQPDIVKYTAIVDGPPGSPYATQHHLGWALNGPVTPAEVHNTSCFRTKLDIESQINAYFSRDFGDLAIEEQSSSVEDLLWYQRVNGSVHQLPSGNYSTNLPFRVDNINLANNRFQALKRFEGTRSRLLKNPKYFAEYNDFMTAMFESNFAEIIPENRLIASKGQVYYLVHHSVHHKLKNKIRIVFDASLKYQEASLNSQLLQGPDLTNNLLGVLLRFRQNKVAVTADIAKMFYQVKVNIKHRDFLRFFWLPEGNPARDPVECRLNVHVFGATSSPSIANYILHKTADDYAEHDSLAHASIKRYFYVDDFLQSFSCEKSAAEAALEVRRVLLKGGFNLTGFVSNSKYVLQSLDQSLLSKGINNIDLCSENLPADYALGLFWDVQLDELGFKMNLPPLKVTRRGVLSTMYSLFDPMGLVCPAILPAKLIFQRACKEQLGWDDPLPVDLSREWEAWLRQAHMLTKYRVSRCIKPPGEVINCQLHIFSDGSERAYASVAYIRYALSNGENRCHIIMAKSRVVPQNHKIHATIPKIELQAARLSVSIYQILKRELDITFDSTHFWSDSTTVLQYLNSSTGRFQRYVANRVAYIRAHTEIASWRHVPGIFNPCDVASRGIEPSKFLQHKMWKHGPAYLQLEASHWPLMPNLPLIPINDAAIKKEAKLLVTVAPAEDTDIFSRLINTCSDWLRLKRRFGWLLRLKAKLRGQSYSTTEFTPDELYTAEREICRIVQVKAYPDIIAALKQHRLSKNNRFNRLCPFIEMKDGLLRVGGRLKYSRAITYAEKHPIILPNNSHVSELIVRHTHVSQCGHLGRESVRSALRHTYWIERDSRLVRKVLHNCIVCKKVKGKFITQRMSDLPPDRIESDQPPFFSTGIDFFGPFYVAVGRGKQKYYGVVFSCMASRAIHIEVAQFLTTDSFINALRRFISRRGDVQTIRCDNGKNLVGAATELHAALDGFKQGAITRSLQTKGIRWLFRPPLASHFGGCWEREIRTIRQILNSLLHEQPVKLTLENLTTLLCETEAILNNRPLVPSSSDPDDMEALTPNHLLLGRPDVICLPPGEFSKNDMYAHRRWRRIQYLADLFWTRWRKAYLGLLQRRQKWTSLKPPLRVGDLVLVADLLLPRNVWPLGKVIEAVTSRDGLVRSAKVKIARHKDPKRSFGTHVLERPLSKLILLRAAYAL